MAVNPNTWQSMDMSQPGQWKVFINQLVLYLTGNFSPAGLAAILNGSGLLNASGLVANTAALGTESASFTFNCKEAALSVVSFTFNAAITATFSNLPIGAMLVAVTTASGAHTLKMAASTPNNTAYTAITANYAGTPGTGTNMISTGIAYSTGVSIVYVGGSLTGPALNFVAS